jgi:hypothetical protein
MFISFHGPLVECVEYHVTWSIIRAMLSAEKWVFSCYVGLQLSCEKQARVWKLSAEYIWVRSVHYRSYLQKWLNNECLLPILTCFKRP